MKQPVAFFDIDGTVFRSSLLVELVEELIERDVFKASVRETYQQPLHAWRARTGSYEAYIEAVIQAFVSHIGGVSYTDFSIAGQKVVARKGSQVYRFTREYIKELRAAGYVIVAISQSPKVILDTFCLEYGFDKVYGRRYEMDINNRFTGRVLDEELISDKSKIATRVFARHPELSTENSIAVGDTEGDIPLLNSVSKPVCFNPNQALYDHAKRNGWLVVVERKDVVYHL